MKGGPVTAGKTQQLQAAVQNHENAVMRVSLIDDNLTRLGVALLAEGSEARDLRVVLTSWTTE